MSPILSSGRYKTKVSSGSKTRTPAALSEITPLRSGPGTEEALTSSEPGLMDHLSALWSGQRQDVLNYYREQLDPDDVRLNLVEIQVLSALTKGRSESSYSYRDHEMTSTDLKIRSNVWFTPLIGLTGSMRFSLAGSIFEEKEPKNPESVHHEEMELGVKVRHHFNLSATSPVLEARFYYIDDDYRLASDSMARLRTETTGFGLGVQGLVHSSKELIWTLGAFYEPQLSHREMSGDLSARSGYRPQTAGHGIELGGEWKMKRSSQVVYGVEYRSEKNQFDGRATLVDPESGIFPNDIGVTSTRLTFSLGYRWGH